MLIRGSNADAGSPEQEEEAEGWVDDGSLPLDKEGALPFYFLDAHEEYKSPDTVYLFGKVRMPLAWLLK